MNNNSIQTRGIGKGRSLTTTSYGESLSTKIVVNNNDNDHNHTSKQTDTTAVPLGKILNSVRNQTGTGVSLWENRAVGCYF